MLLGADRPAVSCAEKRRRQNKIGKIPMQAATAVGFLQTGGAIGQPAYRVAYGPHAWPIPEELRHQPEAPVLMLRYFCCRFLGETVGFGSNGGPFRRAWGAPHRENPEKTAHSVSKTAQHQRAPARGRTSPRDNAPMGGTHVKTAFVACASDWCALPAFVVVVPTNAPGARLRRLRRAIRPRASDLLECGDLSPLFERLEDVTGRLAGEAGHRSTTQKYGRKRRQVAALQGNFACLRSRLRRSRDALHR